MSVPIRAVIVDDEPLARACVREVLRTLDGISVIAEFGDGESAVAGIRKLRPDLVYLDVQMPGLDGFDVVSELACDVVPAIVFVTAFDQYAVRAFDVHAIDYVLKPFTDERLRRATLEAQSRLDADRWDSARTKLVAMLEELSPSVVRTEAGVPRTRVARRILVKSDDEVMRFVRLDEVAYMEAAGNNVRLHTSKAVHEVRMTLRWLLPQLDTAVFRRIHRSTVVNVNAVKEIQPWFAGDCVVVLHDGRTLRMSRTYRDQLMQLIL